MYMFPLLPLKGDAEGARRNQAPSMLGPGWTCAKPRWACMSHIDVEARFSGSSQSETDDGCSRYCRRAEQEVHVVGKRQSMTRLGCRHKIVEQMLQVAVAQHGSVLGVTRELGDRVLDAVSVWCGGKTPRVNLRSP